MASLAPKYASQQNIASSSSSDCGNMNCPRHGHTARNPSGLLLKNSVSRSTSSVNAHDPYCNDKNCPKHSHTVGTGSLDGQSIKVTTMTSRRADGVNNGSLGTTDSQGGLGKDGKDLVERTRYLRVTAPASRTGGTNNVMTFITNNNNTVETPYSSLGTSPSVSPMKPSEQKLSTGSDMYDQMRMEHAMKENVVLQSITIKQNEEISRLKKQVEDLQSKLEAEQADKFKLKVRLKELMYTSQESTQLICNHQETIKTLKAKLNYSDLKAKQLKRMASDNAATASKWRLKLMESLQAQNELEEKKNASAKAAIGMMQQHFQGKNKNMVNSKYRREVTTESNFDAGTTMSTTVGSYDSVMDMTTSSIVAEVGDLI